MRNHRKVWLVGMALTIALGLTGCSGKETPSTAASLPPAATLPAESSPTASPTPAIAVNVKAEAVLSFANVASEQRVERMSGGEDSADILLEKPVDGGTIIAYAKPKDAENVYAQYRTEAARYELGVVGGLSPKMDDEQLSVTTLELYGRSLVRINGVFGANAPVQNYYALEDDGGIAPFLRVDTGHAQEIDLDGDGTTEIISTYGLPTQTYVYAYEDNRFKMADVNAALGALAVYLGNNGGFEANYELGSAVAAHYDYTKGMLKLTSM
ncbi:hypothetical protein [Cohnella yongneupensis]|uniref:VCBS repeat-containing protein n=1 Tax=Cohnella yongneupensis TaxID=425006 RepID=A0ABW0R3B8_9BACL